VGVGVTAGVGVRCGVGLGVGSSRVGVGGLSVGDGSRGVVVGCGVGDGFGKGVDVTVGATIVVGVAVGVTVPTGEKLLTNALTLGSAKMLAMPMQYSDDITSRRIIRTTCSMVARSDRS
jgi:hypothetical protein